MLIDEFAALGAGHVARLFGRARGAGIGLVLATQEIADLEAVAGRTLRDQAGGNLGALIAYRQNMPDSAELIARMAGTEPGWSTRQQVRPGLLGPRIPGAGSRTREHQPTIYPLAIMRLGVGRRNKRALGRDLQHVLDRPGQRLRGARYRAGRSGC